MTPRLLDLTRLVSRLGRPALTGVDRVERAWAEHLLKGDAMQGAPLFALVRNAWGFALLDAAGVRRVLALTDGAPLDPPDLIGRLSRRGDALRARAETEIRRIALARCAVPGLLRLLRRLPAETAYFNMGHSNLTPRMMAALRGPVVVLIHDTIPLDHPEFTRADIPAVFTRKLAAVSARADLVVHSAAATRALTEAHLARLGRVPPGIVAPLGITAAAPGVYHVPGLDPSRRFFVTVGTIEPRKNHALLLAVWAELARRLPPAQLPQLVIAGSRGWRNMAVFQALDSRPAGVIEVAGLGDAALSGLIHASQGLLFPSHVEGFGLPPMEAASLGAPVCVSDLPVLREMLGDYPVYLKPTDVYSWLETIERLSGVERLTDKGVGGKGTMTRRWIAPTWDAHFNAVLNIV